MAESEQSISMLNKLPLQLYGTSSLCFDKDEFLMENFSVENFIKIYQSVGSSNLENLRDDLGIYLKLLRSAMIELINQDYADFVNLSTNLTGLDKLIESLKTPLGQIRDEVLGVQRLLQEATKSVSCDLEERKHIKEQKVLIQKLMQLNEKIDRIDGLMKTRGDLFCSTSESEAESGVILDKVAAEVNHLKFLLNFCSGSVLLDSIRPRASKICEFVDIGLEREFREGIIGKDRKLLRKTLCTYSSLGSIDKGHSLVRNIMRDKLQDVVYEEALKSDPRGLQGMYSNILTCVTDLCEPLCAVTSGSQHMSVKGYSFVQSSVWPEIAFALETRTPHIFSPVNPVVFHKQYCDTSGFLEALEELIGDSNQICKFRKTKAYVAFMNRWNLPVYFQIRYQEIGHEIERTLMETSQEIEESAKREMVEVSITDDHYMLSSSQAIWDAVQKCYQPEIFIWPLLHRFWKLNLLILSRHDIWLDTTLSKLKEFSSDALRSSSNAVRDKRQFNLALIAMYFYHDVERLAVKLSQFTDDFIKVQLPSIPQEKLDIMKAILEKKCKKLSLYNDDFKNLVVTNLISLTSQPLKQIMDTPRIYRRTNKQPPVAHQPYVSNSISFMMNFKEKSRDVLDGSVFNAWMNETAVVVCDEYYRFTHDVLSSVHKMEESLKRLKRARDKGTSCGSETSAGPTDDDKIRLQIEFDVKHFGEQLCAFGIELDGLQSFKRLQLMVQNAMQEKFVT